MYSQSCRYGALDPSVISGLHGLFVPAQDTISCMHDTLDQNGDANIMLMLIFQQLVIKISQPDYGTRRLCERTLYYQLEITNHQKTCPHYKDTGNNNPSVDSTHTQRQPRYRATQ